MKASAVFVFIGDSQTLGFSERLQEKEKEKKNENECKEEMKASRR